MISITLAFSEILKDGESTDLQILRKPSEEGESERMPPESIFMSAVRKEASRHECIICL